MQALLHALAILCLLAIPALADGPEPECGVGMPHTTGTLSFDPATIEVSKVFLIEGGLVHNGTALCIAVSIQCFRETNICEMIEVPLLRIMSHSEIGPITLSDPMHIVEWTKHGLIAAGQTHLCQRTQLSVDFDERKVQLVKTPLCPPGKPARVEELQAFPMSEQPRS
jgi:hypothetical protein